MSEIIPYFRGPHCKISDLSSVPEKHRDTLCRLLDASMPKSTCRVYRWQLRRFMNWCDEYELCPLPALPTTVATYISSLADEGLCNSTIRQSLAALSAAHKLAGLPTPTTDIIVKKAVKGFQREYGTAPKKKPAATADLVKKMLIALEARGTPRDVRDAALLAVGFAGGFRRSELAALNIEDLSWETEDGIECCVIQIRRSKTDQEGKGMEKAIFAEADPRFSPTHLLRRWLELAGISEGALFRRLRRGGHVQEHGVEDQVVVRSIKRAAKMAGIMLDLSAHSLRSGFVTTAIRQGCSFEEIMVQTGHKTISVLQGYYQRRNVRERNAARKVMK